jgi:curved DNA-binding protein CbpA
MATHYEVLGVAPTASADEIRRTYLKLARDGHPDRFTDPAEKAKAHTFFQQATEAFNTLSNEQRRRSYDQELAKPKLEKPEDLAKDAFARAQKMAESREDQEAVDLLHVAIHHQPNEAQYHAALGRLLSRHPRHARDAVSSFEKAAKLAPDKLSYHLELTAALNAQGLKIRAKKALEPALKLAPQDANVVRLAAELGLGQPEQPEKPKPPAGLAGLKNLFGKKS